MAKIRIHQLAKEMGVPNKDLVARLIQLGFDVKNHMSTLEDDEAVKVRQLLGKKETPIKENPREEPLNKEAPKDTRTVEARPIPKATETRVNQTVARPVPKTTESRVKRTEARPVPKTTESRVNRAVARPVPKTTESRVNRAVARPVPKTTESRVKRTEPLRDDKRKSSLAQKEAMKRTQAQNQRKLLSKTAISAPGRGKHKHKSYTHEHIEQAPTKITIDESITVQELANRMRTDGAEVIKKLIELDVMASINQDIDSKTATLLAAEFGIECEVVHEVNYLETALEDTPDDPADLLPKPPVITVMGHVDHGKTSVLDAIRQTNVIATEAGGITQRIGAYQVELKGKKITFLDTPGHEAFTAMRARGAQVTDIAVLVVAADDGVMPQTVEAINHAKAAGVPIVVAINKIDRPNADPDRVKRQLTEYGLVPEEWGGDTICAQVSAHTKEGLDHLLEMLLLVAEVEEFKANPNRSARGSVIDAQLDKGRGPVATVLIQKGTLHVGDYILAGTAYGKVRAMLDFKGRWIKKAVPSTPVEILGLSEVPNAGDIFYNLPDEKIARQIVSERVNEKREHESVTPNKITLEDLFAQIKEGNIKELNLVVKADVQGSVEALLQALAKLNTSEVRVNMIHSGVGAITETDVMLAIASNGLIIGFNVRPDGNAKKAAEEHQVEIRFYRVIYEAIDDIRNALEGLLEPDLKEVVMGRSEVRDTFRIPKVGAIAGCYISEGKATRNSKVRVIRDSVVIYEGTIVSLRRFKDDVKEVQQGHECGIGLDKFQDLKQGDILEGYVIEEVKRLL
jgi:translation initiation factor IF-2